MKGTAYTRFSLSHCKDCLAFRLGSERKRPHRSARRPRVDSSFSFVISSRFSPLLSPSLSTRPPAQDNCEQITSCPTLTASRFPLFILFVSLSLYFRQRRSTLSRSSTALVRSRIFLYRFLFIFADIFFIFFLQFS